MFVACIWRHVILGKCYMWRRLKAVACVTLKWNLYGIKLIATLFLQQIFMLLKKIKYIHVHVENMRFLSDRCFSSTLWHLFLGFTVQKKWSRGWKASPTRHAFTLRFYAFFFLIYMLAFILADSLRFFHDGRSLHWGICLSLYSNCFTLVVQSSCKWSLPGQCYQWIGELVRRLLILIYQKMSQRESLILACFHIILDMI